jgi:CcmD family protein
MAYLLAAYAVVAVTLVAYALRLSTRRRALLGRLAAPGPGAGSSRLTTDRPPG